MGVPKNAHKCPLSCYRFWAVISVLIYASNWHRAIAIVVATFLVLAVTSFNFLFIFTPTVRFTLTFIFRFFVTLVVALCQDINFDVHPPRAVLVFVLKSWQYIYSGLRVVFVCITISHWVPEHMHRVWLIRILEDFFNLPWHQQSSSSGSPFLPNSNKWSILLPRRSSISEQTKGCIRECMLLSPVTSRICCMVVGLFLKLHVSSMHWLSSAATSSVAVPTWPIFFRYGTLGVGVVRIFSFLIFSSETIHSNYFAKTSTE